MKFASALRLACLGILLALLLGGTVPAARGQTGAMPPVRVALDFHEVDLAVFVRFISELTGKNFVLDDHVTKNAGKITLFSPTKVTVEQAYNMFLAALEVGRFTAIPKDGVIQIVQTAETPPERGVYVYKLKHANATDMTAVLTNLVARSQQIQTVAIGSRPPMRPLTEFEAPVQVFADKATNSIITSSTRAAYQQLRSVIADLDVRQKQVLVEAVILEVAVDRLRQFGTDPLQVLSAGKSGALQGVAGINRLPEDLVSVAQSIGGFASGATTSGALPVLNTVNVRAFLNFLMTATDVNILSTPQVLASDNQKAKIVVGENRPFPTGQAQGITGGTLVTIERKDVGVTLEMTPQVLDDDMVRLEVKQEITAIAENVSQTIGAGGAAIPVGPTTTKRSMETIAVAHDQQTLVIGGLVRDNVVLNESKVPFLGDIPWLGWLFKSETRRSEKLNLLVFLTPHIITDAADVLALNARKATEVRVLQEQSRIDEATRFEQEVSDRLVRKVPTPGNRPPALIQPPAP